MKVSKSPLMAGGASGCFPKMTSPVEPLSESHSPSVIARSPITTTYVVNAKKVVPLLRHFFSLFLGTNCRKERSTLSASFTRISAHPEMQHFPHPRATTAAWDVMPPLAVRIPAAACIPPTSSGLVSVLTYKNYKSFSPKKKNEIKALSKNESTIALTSFHCFAYQCHSKVLSLQT